MAALTVAATVWHALSVAIMTWGYMGLETTVMHSLIETQKGGHLQFLTVQALAVSWLTMVLGLCSDLLPTVPLLRNAKRAFFLIAMPLCVVVTSIYWTLITLLPSLILPPAPHPSEPSSAQQPPSSSSDALALLRIPLRLDLALHAAPALTLLLDFFLFERSYGPVAARYGAMGMSAAFGVWYAAWVEYLAGFNGTFPYPFLTVSPFPIRVVIYVVVTLIAFLSFRGLNALHKRIMLGPNARVGKKGGVECSNQRIYR